MTNELWIGLALMLVFEGMLPFLSPKASRRAYSLMASQDDRSLRTAGFAAMAIGLLLLYLVK